ncbi:chemoreceptor glutamine deamidase CheD [Alteromonas sediminis]|uniref:Probable chemoreceptor glutamine deamidase CheD n=1 Tax=Alteromonas sediminis TaxID=2259342 RepID=A0A3N5Y3Q6_9ALTE|nr:chemoreceptor glutamine deamidase CheD [Alteromonas sediminis]RPJ68602.1 chemoreceptor glutamine deamidase CheD [Alteromonas sediminis]
MSEANAPNRYYDRYFQRQAVKILPGEFYATAEKTLIVTVLGSCLSVCLRDPLTAICGMNHFLLPFEYSAGATTKKNQFQYGDVAVGKLITEMVKLGASESHIEAKVFGAANLMQGLNMSNVGQSSADFVLAYLRYKEIPLIASDLLDQFPRKVYFFPETGEVKVKKIKNLNNTTILDRESEYRMRLRQTL